MTRIQWPGVLQRAAQIVNEYETNVTLRQLFYRLVSEQLIPNTLQAYKGLSTCSAQARRDRRFPKLIDRGREIHVPAHWDSPGDVLAAVAAQYRRDRTADQDVSVYLSIEKDGLVTLLESWFGDLGVPILCPRGYAGQSYVDLVRQHVRAQRRPAVLLHGGDFDPSGPDILRDFAARCDCWTMVVLIALTPEQVSEYDLPENAGKKTDSRAPAFERANGRLCQVEIDALPPDVLRSLYQEQIDEFWDMSVFRNVLATEGGERAELIEIAEGFNQR